MTLQKRGYKFFRPSKVDLKEDWFEFPDKERFTMEDVYNKVVAHSRLIDRLNPRKMVRMTFDSFDFLNGALEEPDGKWKFF